MLPHRRSRLDIRRLLPGEKPGAPPVSRRGSVFLTDYSAIKQQAPGQHEPPPQQSSSLVATGVAAVSPINAANMSKYFITPPFEGSFASRQRDRAEPLREEELNARRWNERTIRARFANGVLRTNGSFGEQRGAGLFDDRANQNQRGTGGSASVRHLGTLNRHITATIYRFCHPRARARIRFTTLLLLLR